MIKVLDQGFVELQDMMGNDLAIVNAARTSYLGESKGEEKDKELLFYLLRNGHTTPFEQVVFKFRVKAPLMVTQQWFRHRTWSINSSSARYREHDEFYVPEKWRLQDTVNRQGGFGAHERSRTFSGWLEQNINDSLDIYRFLLSEGVAKEQARAFLPAFCMYYTFVGTIDAHNLMHFLRLRMGEHAQWEIRQYANAIFSIFEEKLPWTAEAFKEQLNG